MNNELNIKNFREYVNLALRTESNFNPLKEEVEKDTGLSHRILHGVLGIYTELSEAGNASINDDVVNLAEEAGDILWFIAILADELEKRGYEVYDKVDKLLSTFPSEYDNVVDEILDVFSKLLDQIKASLFYKREFDYKVVEEIIFLGAKVAAAIIHSDQLQDYKPYTASDVMVLNIKKLQARYPEKFDFEKANKRDLEKEREVLKDE
jgi:NTP pyrophosphatase (non-canonical NTP hydrolase)